MQNNNTKSGASRFSWVDIAKGIAILLVVYRHILIGIKRSGIEVEAYLLQLNEMVYSFRMPLFFILSGIFFARSVTKRKTSEFVNYKLRSLIYPYILWALIQVTLQVIMSKYTNADRDLYDYAYILIQPSAIDQLWFLYSLFNVTMAYFFLKYIVRIPLSFLAVVSVVFYYLSVYVKEYSLIHDILYYMLFFLVGDLMSDKMLSEKFQSLLRSKKVILAMLPVFLVSQWYWLNNQQDINIMFFGLVALFGSFFTIAISLLIAPAKFSNVFESIGRNSLQIYVMHVLISSGFRIISVKFLGIRDVYVLLAITFVTGVIIPLYIVKLSKKYPAINWLFAPPKKQK